MINLKLHLQNDCGGMKPLHGINNGPISLGGLCNTETEYSEIGIPFVRFHDTDYPYPQAIDVYQIFRDFNADPNDPSMYDFCLTDQYVSAAIRSGASVIYRLGVSIEHMKKKRWVAPPEDYEKFAAVCRGIVRHYNEGFADGFHYGIRFWEIWNEPESELMWSGTTEQYFSLYEIVSKQLKDEFGSAISVGGYASCGFYGIEKPQEERTCFQKKFIGFFSDFLAFVKRTDSPFEFYSFHFYGDNPNEPADHARYIRSMLDDMGFAEVPVFLDEWNSADLDTISDMRGARRVLAMMKGFADSPIDLAAYYDGQPHMRWCGLFDKMARKTNTFYAFSVYNKLYRLGTRMKTELDAENICMAAHNGKNVGVFILSGESEENVLLTGICIKEAKAFLLDESHELTPHESKIENGGISFMLPKNAVLYIEIQAE